MIISSERSISSTSLQKDHGYTYRFWITFLKPFIKNPVKSLKKQTMATITRQLFIYLMIINFLE